MQSWIRYVFKNKSFDNLILMDGDESIDQLK